MRLSDFIQNFSKVLKFFPANFSNPEKSGFFDELVFSNLELLRNFEDFLKIFGNYWNLPLVLGVTFSDNLQDYFLDQEYSKNRIDNIIKISD